MSSASTPPTAAKGTLSRISVAKLARVERGEQQEEDGDDGDGHHQGQAVDGALLVLEGAGPDHAVAGRQPDRGAGLCFGLVDQRAEVAAADGELDGDAALVALAHDPGQPGAHLDFGEGAEGQPLAVGAKDRDVADGVQIGDGLGGDLDDQVEGALAFEHLGGDRAAQRGFDHRLDVGHAHAEAGDGRAVHRDLDLRLAR